MTSTSSGPTPVSSYTLCAASRVISLPMRVMELFWSNVSGVSVTIVCPMISTALSSSECRRTNSSLASTTAPEPSEVGQHWSFVSGSCTIGAARISSRVYSSWNCE